MAVRTKKFTATANPEYAAAIHNLRSSGAAGTHNDKRTKRARTRDASKKRAINDFK